MFSYVLSSGTSRVLSKTYLPTPLAATSYFHLPIEEDEDDDFPTSRHIAWTPSAESTDSDDSDSGAPPPPSSPSQKCSKARQNHKDRAIIQEILSENDLYRILGLQRSSRIDKMALRRAYLARSKACHPECVYAFTLLRERPLTLKV